MTLYCYKAVNRDGATAKGWLEATSVDELEARLAHAGQYLIHAAPGRKKYAWRGARIKRTEQLHLYFNLEQLLRSGVPLLESLTDFRDSMEGGRFRDVIASMIEAIGGGSTLSQAMAQHPEVFGHIHVRLVHAGEVSGRLEDMFRHLADALKWQEETATQARSVMLYPAMAATVLLGVTAFLMLYLVPQLADFIQGAGQEIPPQTRLLLAVSALCVHYWPVLLALPPLLLGAAALALKFEPALHYPLDRLKLHIWFAGPVLRKLILARFAHAFAMMYESGISVLDCLAHARDLSGNRVLAASLERIAQEVAAGKNLTQSFRDAGLFPPLVLRMLHMGETTGRLDIALRNVGYFYARDARDAIQRAQTLAGPAVTVMLGLLLGWVMLSVLAPVYGIIGKAAL